MTKFSHTSPSKKKKCDGKNDENLDEKNLDAFGYVFKMDGSFAQLKQLKCIKYKLSHSFTVDHVKTPKFVHIIKENGRRVD